MPKISFIPMLLVLGAAAFGGAWLLAPQENGSGTGPSDRADRGHAPLRTRASRTTPDTSRSLIRREPQDHQPSTSLEAPPTPLGAPAFRDALVRLRDSETPLGDDLSLLGKAIRESSPADLEEILRWSRGLERDSGIAMILIHETLNAWTSIDPKAAFNNLVEIAGSNDDQLLSLGLPITLAEWSKAEPETVWLELGRRGLIEDQSELASQILKNWSKQDPRGAAAAIFALSSGEELPGSEQAASAVTSGLWKLDPEEARTWVMSLPGDQNAAAGAMSALLGCWLEEKPLEASEWLRQQPPSGAKDAGITALIGLYQDEEPEISALWAAEIQAPDSRRQRMLLALRAWQDKDRDAVNRFLSGTELISREEAEELRSTLNPAPEENREDGGD